jgi:hypothetical protein
MSADLETIPAQIVEARSNIAAIREFIAKTSDPQQILGAKDRIKLAREWAKIQKVAAEVHADLIRIEIDCLRRIADLDALQILGTHERSAAKFFASLDLAGVEAVVTDFGRASTAIGVFRAFEKSQRDDFRRDRGRARAEGREFDEADEYFETAARYYATSVRAALAALVDEFATYQTPFTVDEVADDLIDNAGLPTDMDPAMREGVAEVCRTALRKAAPVVIGGYSLPKFITCYDAETGGFVRIPASRARVCQLEQMVAVRREQLAQDTAAFQRLEHTLTRITESAPAPDALIVDVIEGSPWLKYDMPSHIEAEMASAS